MKPLKALILGACPLHLAHLAQSAAILRKILVLVKLEILSTTHLAYCWLDCLPPQLPEYDFWCPALISHSAHEAGQSHFNHQVWQPQIKTGMIQLLKNIKSKFLFEINSTFQNFLQFKVIVLLTSFSVWFWNSVSCPK